MGILDFWIKDSGDMICPVCDYKVYGEHFYRYCPFCGNRLHFKYEMMSNEMMSKSEQ